MRDKSVGTPHFLFRSIDLALKASLADLIPKHLTKGKSPAVEKAIPWLLVE
jgi:hypothetical protein